MPVTIDGSNGVTFPAGGLGNTSSAAVGINDTQTLTNKTITGLALSAGTTSVAPLDFASGTNLTSPLAGAMEYNGTTFFGTPIGTQRGIIPSAQFFRLNADLVGANVNTAQNLLGVGVTLSASTVYAFEILFTLSKTAGTTSHTVSIGFAGTATLNNIMYISTLNQGTSLIATGGGSSAGLGVIQTAAATVITEAATQATYSVKVILKGTVSINAAGTFIPQYTLSAAPGGAYSTLAGSHALIYPISASGANTNVGTWA